MIVHYKHAALSLPCLCMVHTSQHIPLHTDTQRETHREREPPQTHTCANPLASFFCRSACCSCSRFLFASASAFCFAYACLPIWTLHDVCVCEKIYVCSRCVCVCIAQVTLRPHPTNAVYEQTITTNHLLFSYPPLLCCNLALELLHLLGNILGCRCMLGWRSCG